MREIKGKKNGWPCNRRSERRGQTGAAYSKWYATGEKGILRNGRSQHILEIRAARKEELRRQTQKKLFREFNEAALIGGREPIPSTLDRKPIPEGFGGELYPYQRGNF